MPTLYHNGRKKVGVMVDIQLYISIGSVVLGGLLCLLGLLLSGYLYRVEKNGTVLLLCVGAIVLTWHAVIYGLIYTGHIKYYPQFYNKGIPFYYLIAPCFYFYVELRLKLLTSLPWHRVIHLLPFVFGLIDIIPYAVSPLEDKILFLESLANDLSLGLTHGYGFVDQRLHYILRFSLAAGYVIAQWRLWYIAKERETKSKKEIFRFNVFYTAYIVLQSSMIVAIIFNDKQAGYVLKSLDKLLWVSCFFLLFAIWFFSDAMVKVRRRRNYTIDTEN